MEFIDLGLSIKWAKYNLGANHDSDPKSWYGDYYAWGEIKPKDEYKWINYIHSKEEFNIVKYDSRFCGDNKIVLEPADDVITANYNKNWRMPTKSEFEELLSLPNKYVNNYNNITGLNGMLFTGNDNTLFIPAAGWFNGTYLFNAGSDGSLWSSSLNTDRSIYAYALEFNPVNICINYCGRQAGFPIRGVCE